MNKKQTIVMQLILIIFVLLSTLIAAYFYVHQVNIIILLFMSLFIIGVDYFLVFILPHIFQKENVKTEHIVTKQPDELSQLHDAACYQPNIKPLTDEKASKTIINMIETAHKSNRTSVYLRFGEVDPLFCGLAEYAHNHKQQFEDKHFAISYDYPYASNNQDDKAIEPRGIEIGWEQ